MQRKTYLLFFVILSLYAAPLFAGEKEPSPYWDAFLDVGYRFTLLPAEDLQEILKSEGQKYKQKLGEYINIWESRIGDKSRTQGSAEGATVSATPYPSSVYRRIAVAHLLLYLDSGSTKHLDTAFRRIDGLARKRVTPRTAFWHNLVLAHKSLVDKDSLAFSHHVFRIWNDVIQVLETGQVMLGAKVGTIGFNNSLPYLYENVIHLTLHHGIVKHKTPNLHTLGAIIWSLQGRLEPDKGYYQLAESIWNRMHGLTSDNFSINFAMAFLEGEMHWINFQGARSPSEAAEAFQQARTYFELAFEWADTRKGKAAILTKFMQSMIWMLNSMVQGSKAMSHASFGEIPQLAEHFVSSSRALYRELAEKEIIKDGWWEFEGFKQKKNYIKAMHELWLNAAQLDIMIARYHRQLLDKTTHPSKKIAYFNSASRPLQNYLDLFEDFTSKGYLEIVPDNAYFFAAYFAGELAELYRLKAGYSQDMTEYNLAFARQFQAIEIFPFDIMGLLNLSMQVSQDGTLNTYIDDVWPLAERLSRSRTVATWAKKRKLPYANEVISLQTIIPEAFKSTPSIIGLAGSGKNSKEVIKETLFFTQLLKIILQSDFAHKVNIILSEISEELKKGKGRKETAKKHLPSDIFSQLKPALAIIEKCDYQKLKKELFRNPDDAHHSLLKNIYHEVPSNKIRYLKMLRTLRDRERRKQASEPFEKRRKLGDEGRKKL